MSVLTFILEFFNALADPLIKLAKWLWNGLKAAPPSLRNWLIVLAVAGLVLGGLWFFNRKTEPVGGLDVTGYCKSFKFDIAKNIRDPDEDNKSCESELDLAAACRWQHDDPALRVEFGSPNNAESARCATPSGQDVGGIDNLDGYCQHHHDAEEAAAAVLSDWKDINKSWICKIPLDLDAACAGQHNNDDLEARQNENGLWICYK